MADATIETAKVSEYEAREIQDQLEEDEWESDWGAIFLCCLLLCLVLAGLGIAAWHPWIM